VQRRKFAMYAAQLEIYTTKADGTTERKLQTIELGKLKRITPDRFLKP
jgi:hypothetical protein